MPTPQQQNALRQYAAQHGVHNLSIRCINALIQLFTNL